jgi:hypothetical protein
MRIAWKLRLAGCFFLLAEAGTALLIISAS